MSTNEISRLFAKLDEIERAATERHEDFMKWRERQSIRIDRLEQTDKRRAKILWAVAAVAIGSIARTGWQLLTTGKI